MICDRCGRKNPDHLMFCQDCGRRLVPAGGSPASVGAGFAPLDATAAAVVAPTPPTGLGLVSSAGDAPPRVDPNSAARSVSRPEAPSFSFGPREDDELEPVCGTCKSRNPRTNRFCFACGARLPELSAGSSAAPVSPPPPAPADIAGTAIAAGPAPAMKGAAPAAAPLVCARCNGISEAGMSFCKFCGARLRADPRQEPSPLPDAVRRASAPPPPIAATAASPGVSRSSMRPPAPSAAAAYASPTAPPPALDPAVAATRTSAGESPHPRGRLVTIARDGAQGISYPLDAEQIDLGREEGQIVLPGDGYLSPRHLRLSRRGDKWYARDLGSTNGVYLRLRRPHRLIDGDLLLLGLEVIRFELVKESEQGLGPAMQHGTLVFGSPLLPRRARLCQRTVEGVTRNVYYLTREETIVGRENGDLVFSDDLFMSRRHLSIRRDPASSDFIAEDLGASNGTFVAIRDEVQVADGDFIRVGQHLFRLDLNAERT